MLAKKLHLEASVLACMIFGLISVQGFSCPSCRAAGDDREQVLMDCEVHAVDNECVKEGAAAVCEVMLLDVPSTQVRVIRRCTTKKMHEENKQNCNPQENIMCPQRTICTKSGCRAPLPEVFKCPFCSSSGKETIAAVLKNCDKSAVYEACQEKDPICEVIIREHDSGGVDAQRWCSTKKQQTARKEFCRKFGICPKTAYCTESGCKATLP